MSGTVCVSYSSIRFFPFPPLMKTVCFPDLRPKLSTAQWGFYFIFRLVRVVIKIWWGIFVNDQSNIYGVIHQCLTVNGAVTAHLLTLINASKSNIYFAVVYSKSNYSKCQAIKQLYPAKKNIKIANRFCTQKIITWRKLRATPRFQKLVRKFGVWITSNYYNETDIILQM